MSGPDASSKGKEVAGVREPRIVVFLCNWCHFSNEDLDGKRVTELSPNIHTIRVMCSGQISPLFVLKALQEGADAVLVAGCYPDKCRYEKGNLLARRRITLLRDLLDYIGIDPRRVQMSWLSPKDGAKFEEILKKVEDVARELGPQRKLRRDG